MQWHETEIELEILGKVNLSVRFFYEPDIEPGLYVEGRQGGPIIDCVNLEWKKDDGKKWEVVDITNKLTKAMVVAILDEIKGLNDEPSEPDTDNWPEAA